MLAVALSACKEVAAPAREVVSVRISARADSVEAGDTLQLSASLADSAGQAITGRPVLWYSLDTTIVRVAPSGLVTGVRAGTGNVVAGASEQSDTIAIKVLVPVAKVTILTRVPALVVSDTVRLIASALDSAGQGLERVVSWSVVDSSALRITPTGLLSAVAPGTSRVTARAGRKIDTLAVRGLQVTYTSLGPGRAHTCGISSTGEALCWGDNSVGQLGVTSSQLTQVRPGLVSGGLTFLTVSAANDYDATCGLVVGGSVYCWGGLISFAGPGRVLPLPAASAVSGPCALAFSGQAYCWGFGFAIGGNPTPVNQNSPLVFTAISVQDMACGLGADSLAYCWINPTLPAAVVPGSPKFVAIASGGEHACALTAAGAAYCWGTGANGRLGNGASLDSPSPVPVAGGHVFKAITAGDGHACAIDTSGAAYCWGGNVVGQLGTGSLAAASYDTPQLVTGGLTFTSLAGGSATTCGVTTAAITYCWGLNSFGQLGNGTTTMSAAPMRVAGQP